MAIDQGLTLIAFEAMNHRTRDGNVGLLVLHKNNELAGYCSVLHALALTGTTCDDGRRLRAVVTGATARGAVTALNAHGVPFLRTVLGGPASWDGDETISRAIEIRDGHVVNRRSSRSRAADRSSHTRSRDFRAPAS